MKYPKHFMIDIETTGTDKHIDSILQVGCVEIEFKYPYWELTGREFVRTLHYAGKPENAFAKKFMSELYNKCNETDKKENCQSLAFDLRKFIHKENQEPRYFMGWNASGFDLPFLFDNKILTPSFYVEENGKQEMKGDVHYRIYEQTGSLQLLCNVTGLDSKTIQQIAKDLNPTNISMPNGKLHDALFDCYNQIMMQNGMIALARSGFKR